jgi:hypothetical protein
MSPALSGTGQVVMTNRDTRQFEMLERVRQFGEAHRNLFPKKTEGGRAFATVATVVTELTGYDDAREKASQLGKKAKASVRRALLEKLKAVSRTARVIAEKEPGFGDQFRMPKASKPADQAVLGAGRVFIDEAEPVKATFLAHGLKDPFIAELKDLVQKFGEAIREREIGKERRAVAYKGMTAALSTGLAAARALDVFVANELGGDRTALNTWEHDRKVEAARRPRRATADPPSTPAPDLAAPQAAAPASAGTSAPAAADGSQTQSDSGKPGEAGAAGKAA